MSELREELDALRREVAELKDQMQEARRTPASPLSLTPDGMVTPDAPLLPSSDDSIQGFIERVQREVKENGHPSGIGVMRAVVLHNGGGDKVSVARNSMGGGAGSLPSLDAVLALISPLTNSLAVRALHHFVGCYMDGRDMRMTKTALLSGLSTSEDNLEAALRPLVENETLRWGKTADNEEYYELLNGDLFLTILSFA